MPTLATPPGRFLTKQDLAYQALRRAIMRGELAPGSRVVIDDVAARLEVSIIPVREALARLERERLVEIRPHAGAVVTGLSKDDVAEVFTLMESLEAAAARPALSRATDEDLAALDDLLDGLESARKRRDHERRLERNAAFHLELCRLAGMPLLSEFAARVFDRWERLRRFFFADAAEGTARADQEHRAIVAALRARDADRLERLLREHNQAARQAYRARGG
jgi:DNA-binding GntR family transcriptional regulator